MSDVLNTLRFYQNFSCRPNKYIGRQITFKLFILINSPTLKILPDLW